MRNDNNMTLNNTAVSGDELFIELISLCAERDKLPDELPADSEERTNLDKQIAAVQELMKAEEKAQQQQQGDNASASAVSGFFASCWPSATADLPVDKDGRPMRTAYDDGEGYSARPPSPASM